MNKFSFYDNWNQTWLLVINMVYTNCRPTKDWQSQDNGKCHEKIKTSKNYSLVLSLPPKMKSFSILLKNSWNRNWTFPVVCYFKWKLEFISNTLSMIVVSSSTFFSLTYWIVKLKVSLYTILACLLYTHFLWEISLEGTRR